MPQSSPVSAEQNMTVSQYNNLRDDVLSTTYSHRHSGAAEDGRRIEVVNLLNVGTGVTGATDGQIKFSGSLLRSTDASYAVMSKNGQERLEYATAAYSRASCNTGVDYEGEQVISLTNTFSTAHSVQVTIQEGDYISYTERLRVSAFSGSSVTVKFRFRSSADGVTCTATIHVLVIGAI